MDANAPPAPPVLNIAKAAHLAGHLSRDQIPKFKGLVLDKDPTPVSTSVTGCSADVGAMLGKATGKRKKPMAGTKDVESQDADKEVVAKKTEEKGKKKHAARDKDAKVADLTVSSEEESAVTEEVKMGPPRRKARNIGGKRAKAWRFDGVVVPPKRLKTMAAGIDLSGRIFNEDTDLDPEQFPLVAGAVRNLFSSTGVLLIDLHRHARPVRTRSQIVPLHGIRTVRGPHFVAATAYP